MKRSEIMEKKLNDAEVMLEKARDLVLEVMKCDDDCYRNSANLINEQFDQLSDLVGEVSYEVIMPMELQESNDEMVQDLTELARLEERRAELRKKIGVAV